MKTLYLDCFSGISGNMMIGLLLDLGARQEVLTEAIQRINAEKLGESIEIQIEKKSKNGIEGTYVNFVINHISEESLVHMDCVELTHHGRHLSQVESIIDESDLSFEVKEKSKNIFRILAAAEAKVHGQSMDHVHFHEVGETDSILDIIGTVVCLEDLGVDRIVSSRLHVGNGFMKCSHGMLPVPMPATLEILKDYKIPFYRGDVHTELVTPTGAAIVAGLAESYGEMPFMISDRVGYGAGTKDLDIPNLLRGLLLEEDKEGEDQVCLLEANLDDLSGESLGYVMDTLLDQGALDVYFTPIFMKKNRPATQLSVLCDVKRQKEIADIIFRETTTLGIRSAEVHRYLLERSTVTKETSLGKLRFKKSLYKGQERWKPEYEDVKRIAREKGLPFQFVFSTVKKEIE